MSENEGASIDLTLNVDAAMQSLQELTAAAKDADATLAKLKADMTTQVATAFPMLMGGDITYQHAATIAKGLRPEDLSGNAPTVPAIQQQISERGAAITGAALDFAGQNPQAAGQPIAQLLDQFRQFMAQQQQSAQTQQQAGGGAGAGFTHSPYQGSGSPWPTATPAFGSNPTPDTTQQDRSANILGQRMAESLSRYAGGMLTGGISGAASAAGLGATGDLVGAVAKPLMGLLADAAPLAMGALGIVTGGATTALAVNQIQTGYEQQKQGLSATEGTTTGATPSSELQIAQQVGWQYLFHQKDSIAAAEQLGTAGIASSNMAGGLAASMALARVGNIGLSEATGLTGTLMQAGQSPNDVATTYAQMDEAARQTGVSLSRLIAGVKELGQAAGVGQISVNGLAAAQYLAGPSVNVAQAMAGSIGATGTSALQQGYMLGLDPTAFSAAQRDPAKMWDAYAATARRYDVGAGGERIAQQALSEGGFDFSQFKGDQANTFVEKLVQQGPGAAQAYEASLQKKEAAGPGPHNAADMYQAGVDTAHRVTSYLEQGALYAEKIQAMMALADQNARDAASRDPRFTPSGTDLSAGPNPLHIQPTRPYDSTAILGPPSPYDLGISIPGAGPVTPTALAQAGHRNQIAQDARNRAYQQAMQASGQPVDGSKIGWDASGDSRFGPLSSIAVDQAQQGHLRINGAGVSSSTFMALQAAAQRTGVPLSVLLAQARQEATVNGVVSPNARSADGGVGLAQFTDAGAAMQYLGQASHELGMGPVTAANWRQMALNPQLAAQGMADYDAANLASRASGGRWDRSLAMYNGGHHPNAQAQAYGASVAQGAINVQVQLGGSVDITQNGQKVGSAQAGTHIRATATHSVDPHKRVIASQSYGPQDRTPPAPGLPNLPGHIK